MKQAAYENALFLSAAGDFLHLDLPLDSQEYIVTQIMTALEKYYCHLPLKKSSFGIDPIQEMKILLSDIANNNRDFSFMRELFNVFLRLRDRHTVLLFPPPFRNMVAFLPIVVESYYEGDHRKIVVSKSLPGFEDDRLKPGVEITHWNGIPINRYLKILGMQTSGANPSARNRLALCYLTMRPLGYILPPDEDWVTLNCSNDGKSEAVSLPWKVYVSPPVKSAGSSSDFASSPLMGLDCSLLYSLLNTCELFGGASKSIKSDSYDMKNVDYMRHGVYQTSAGDVGYLRLFSFEVGDLNDFISNMVKVLKTLPQDMLIIDIRNNPGGLIPAGQSLIQLLSDKPVTSSPVAFRNTIGTAGLGNDPQFGVWKNSLYLQSETGQVFSQSFPLVDFSKLPEYRYPGKVALITDALCYSTSDFFAADFKDNALGPIVGIDRTTGAGGANVWSYALLVNFANASGDLGINYLPSGFDMNISMRRSTRTGEADGLPVEGLGVESDFVYRMTLADLLSHNQDLVLYTVQAMKKWTYT